MAVIAPRSEWDANWQYYWNDMPDNIRDKLGRALRQILRHDNDTVGQWLSDVDLLQKIHFAAEYSDVLQSAHVHACLVEANQHTEKFNIWAEWSQDDVPVLLMYKYRAKPGSWEIKWRRQKDYHAKEIAKQLTHVLRKQCGPLKTTTLSDLYARLHALDAQVTENQILLILQNDPLRFSVTTVQGVSHVKANPSMHYRQGRTGRFNVENNP